MAKLDRFIIDNTTYEIVPEIAPLFNPATSYSVGDCVIHDAVLYKFTANHAAGAWTGNDVVAFEVGSELVRLGSGASGSGLTEDVKVALLACFEKVAWIDEDGQDYYDALYNALYPPADLVSISAVFTQGSAVIYNTDSLDTLKQYLVVTAHMSDSSTQTVTGYTLSGTLTAGTSIITVSYGGKTTTFNVTVTDATQGALYYWDLTESLTDKVQGVTLQTPTYYVPNSGYVAPAIGSNGAEFLASTAGGTPYALQATNVLAADRTIVIDLYSCDINNSSTRNHRIFTTIVTSSYGSDTGLMYRGGSSAWGFYNRSSSAWQMPTGEWVTDTDYFSGKQIKCYIDTDKYWNIYVDDVFLFKTSNVVNSDGTLSLGTGLLNSNSTPTTANAVMTISSVKIYEGQV